MGKSFDFEALHHCQFELLDRQYNPFDCGDPAIYRVWWADDKSDAMLVCPEHFYIIYKREVKNGRKDSIN